MSPFIHILSPHSQFDKRLGIGLFSKSSSSDSNRAYEAMDFFSSYSHSKFENFKFETSRLSRFGSQIYNLRNSEQIPKNPELTNWVLTNRHLSLIVGCIAWSFHLSHFSWNGLKTKTKPPSSPLPPSHLLGWNLVHQKNSAIFGLLWHSGRSCTNESEIFNFYKILWTKGDNF